MNILRYTRVIISVHKWRFLYSSEPDAKRGSLSFTVPPSDEARQSFPIWRRLRFLVDLENVSGRHVRAQVWNSPSDQTPRHVQMYSGEPLTSDQNCPGR